MTAGSFSEGDDTEKVTFMMILKRREEGSHSMNEGCQRREEQCCKILCMFKNLKS